MMALLRIGFNEGSLLRRTLLHVGTFVLGSIAFISLMSFLLVSVAKGILPPAATTDATAEQQGEDGEAKGKASTPKGTRKKPSVVVNDSPSKDD
jgi:hypothetical protein